MWIGRVGVGRVRARVVGRWVDRHHDNNRAGLVDDGCIKLDDGDDPAGLVDDGTRLIDNLARLIDHVSGKLRLDNPAGQRFDHIPVRHDEHNESGRIVDDGTG